VITGDNIASDGEQCSFSKLYSRDNSAVLSQGLAAICGHLSPTSEKKIEDMKNENKLLPYGEARFVCFNILVYCCIYIVTTQNKGVTSATLIYSPQVFHLNTQLKRITNTTYCVTI